MLCHAQYIHCQAFLSSILLQIYAISCALISSIVYVLLNAYFFCMDNVIMTILLCEVQYSSRSNNLLSEDEMLLFEPTRSVYKVDNCTFIVLVCAFNM